MGGAVARSVGYGPPLGPWLAPVGPLGGGRGVGGGGDGLPTLVLNPTCRPMCP